MFVPPLALNQANSCCSATSEVTSVAAVDVRIDRRALIGVLERRRVAGGGGRVGDRVVERRDIFREAAVTDHRPLPVGSHTTPRRGLKRAVVGDDVAGAVLALVLVPAQAEVERHAVGPAASCR